jgi:hypothetical protein
MNLPKTSKPGEIPNEEYHYGEEYRNFISSSQNLKINFHIFIINLLRDADIPNLSEKIGDLMIRI